MPVNFGSASVSVSLSDADVERIAQALRDAGGREFDAEPWYDVDGAAAYLACSRKRIYDLVSQGRLRVGRDGRRLVFRREWLDAVIELGDENDVPEGLEIRATGQ
jgi:excisionase family DNA binding protein